MQILGLDFSINKPAACMLIDGKYTFMSWPFGLSERLKDIFKEAGVKIIDRTDVKYKGQDSSQKMRWESENSIYISDLMISSLPDGDYMKDLKVIFEGISYASSGNMAIQLGGYKYVLMRAFFDEMVRFPNMFTYAPITIKKTAGASKKGMGKAEMIESFIERTDNDLSKTIKADPDRFKKKTGKWIDHLDDLVDAYWAIQTYIEKEGLA